MDLAALAREGIDIDRAFADARRKDGSAEPATLAWILEQIAIGPEAPLPGGTSAEAVTAVRDDLVRRLRAMAFREARRDPA